jgi:tetratricopeptide (TPR) repeat protein
MRCPFCQTENREDRETCYACGKNISMLRLVVNKARHHYNMALEHAERGRIVEAINELHHALDLDKRLTQAHVVLGTLHAKRGEFEQARASWEAALAIQPELLRAHQYIEKLGFVERALPGLARWRRWALTAATVAAVATALCVWLIMSGPPVHILAQAKAAIDRNDYGNALRLLDKADSLPDRTGATEYATTGLRALVRVSLSNLVNEVRQLKYANEYPKALARISEIERYGVDLQTSITLSDIRQDISHYYRQQIEDLYQQYTEDKIPLSILADRIQEYLAIYPDVPERAEITGYLQKARETEATRAITALRNDLAKMGPAAAVEALRKISQRFPGSKAVAEGRKAVIEAILDNQISEFTKQLDARQFGRAREILAQMNEMRDEFRHVLDRADPLEYAREALLTEERSDRLRQAERLITRGDLTEASLMLLDLSEDPALTTAEREILERGLNTLELKRRAADVEALRALLPKFLQRRATPEETSVALERMENLVASLASLPPPPPTNPRPPELIALNEAMGAGLAAAITARREDLIEPYEALLRRQLPMGIRSPMLDGLMRLKNSPPAAASRRQ